MTSSNGMRVRLAATLLLLWSIPVVNALHPQRRTAERLSRGFMFPPWVSQVGFTLAVAFIAWVLWRDEINHAEKLRRPWRSAVVDGAGDVWEDAHLVARRPDLDAGPVLVCDRSVRSSGAPYRGALDEVDVYRGTLSDLHTNLERERRDTLRAAALLALLMLLVASSDGVTHHW